MSDSPDIAQLMQQLQGSSSLPEASNTPGLLPNGKKTKGRVKIKMEYIGNKLRRYTTFSKRKTGIMKKAYELSTLTGTQVMLLVASETGHVYTYATKKLQPMINSEAGKNLIQTCLNAPEDGSDLQPTRTEFTFESSSTPPNPRKRKADTDLARVSDVFPNSLSSFLPTMVPSTLFSSYGEDDYNEADESGEDTDSEEPSENGLQPVIKEEPKGFSDEELAATMLKEALKAAQNHRQQQQHLKRQKQQQQQQQQQQQHKSQHIPSHAFLAPFLLNGLTTTTSSNGATVLKMPQGCLQTNTSSPPQGGANPDHMFMQSSSKAEDAKPPVLPFPFSFNLQQLMESAALGQQITNSSD